ncbi:MAG: hypothetical protein QM743_05440 [Chitinophagaceae bacterium]
MKNLLKDELQNIVSGKSTVRFGRTIQTITGHLKKSTQTGQASENTEYFRDQEKQELIRFISAHQLWYGPIDFGQYVSAGAEQRVFLKGSSNVFKLNDAIYYASWTEYLNNLLLHNFFFPDTAYDLIGFTSQDNVLYAVVQQAFVECTETTDLWNVKSFLTENGFVNTRNNDYYNSALGIILEDLHDENVLTRNGILYFIDTVFYTTPEFWLDT